MLLIICQPNPYQPQRRHSLPVLHMLRRIHIHKRRPLLARQLPTITKLGKPRPSAFLFSTPTVSNYPMPTSQKKSPARTLDNRSSVATWHTSRYFVTSHGSEPSYSFTRETGAVLRSRANSAGGSRPEARLKGKLGASDMVEALRALTRVVPGRSKEEMVVGRWVLRRSDAYIIEGGREEDDGGTRVLY